MKIECYNERNARSCNVRLTNLVETVNAAGVNISLPQGTIKLNISPLITHLKFTLHGVQWIVKVTNRVSLGNDLYNISYSIDWLKDYWLKYADNTGHYMIARTDNATYISKYIPDNQFVFTGNFNRITQQGAAIADLRLIVIIAPPRGELYPQVYAVSGTGALELLQSAIFINEKFNKTVLNMFLAPISPTDIISVNWNNVGQIAFPQAVQSTDPQPVTPLVYDTGYIPASPIPITTGIISKYTYTNKNVVTSHDTQLSIPHNDWRDMYSSKYALYVPLIGMVNIDTARIHGNITINYYVDLIGGTVKATINGDRTTMTAPCSLPIVTITSASDAVSSVRIAQNQFSMNQQRIGTDALLAGAQGALGGSLAGPIGAGAGLVSSFTTSLASGFFSNQLSYNIAVQNAAVGGVSTSSASAYEGILYDTPFMVTIAPGENNTMAQHIALNGAPSQKYVEHLSDLAPGYYWLDCSNALIYGGTDYESAYRQALHNVRINVN